MTAPPAGPVADFWAELHRLVRACRVPQTEIASVLDLSGASVSELLNGRRRRVPEWEVVRRILALCAKRRGPGAAVPPAVQPGRVGRCLRRLPGPDRQAVAERRAGFP
ncbi:helix-turn-helix domain-containing protein [Streptomyces sp. NPDC093060]|uniref:helix-turn-helix domain-containing protein n=1 Tax=Streptomyces sp. NPDC093060 TaxID=3366019 RepID=UPI0037F547D3